MAAGIEKEPSSADAISRQEALEHLETLKGVERIFSMLFSQGFSTAQATASGFPANSGACTSGAVQEHLMYTHLNART